MKDQNSDAVVTQRPVLSSFSPSCSAGGSHAQNTSPGSTLAESLAVARGKSPARRTIRFAATMLAAVGVLAVAGVPALRGTATKMGVGLKQLVDLNVTGQSDLPGRPIGSIRTAGGEFLLTEGTIMDSNAGGWAKSEAEWLAGSTLVDSALDWRIRPTRLGSTDVSSQAVPVDLAPTRQCADSALPGVRPAVPRPALDSVHAL